MKKIFFKYNKNWETYNIFENSANKNDELYSVIRALNPMQDFEVNVDVDQHSVTIYSKDSIKKAADIDMKPIEQWRAFDDEYEKYYDKRWDEIPKIELSLSDWQELQEKWKKIKEEKPQYIMFTLDDSGELDTVSLIGKHELSQEDIAYMQNAHEEYLAWQKAERLYNYDHGTDDIWRSSADSVYDVDIAKYLGRNVGFIEHKKYTKKEVIAELQEKLRKKEPVYLIIHWLYVQRGYGIEDADEPFLELLQQFGYMDMNWEPMISFEHLQEIADRLSLGQDVKL